MNPNLKTGGFRWAILLLVTTFSLSFAALVLNEWYTNIPSNASADFIGGASCIDCHREQYELFRGSDHDRAMEDASEITVLGSFDGSTIEHHGVTSKVFRSGRRFMVNTEGPDGQMHDYEVTKVFGCEPLQQYMVEMKKSSEKAALGQYQVLRLSWDVEKEKWFYLDPPDVNEKIEPGDPLHWTGITQRWNTSCAACHSTNLKKNFNSLTKTYSTTFTDIDVNCEGCHGPGSLHVEIAENRRFFWDGNHGLGLKTNLKSTSNLPQVEACAPCHSRRSEIQSGHQAGCAYDDYYSCQVLSRRNYHDDGQIRDEDYVYGSFIQSRMFHQGIRCTDCHDPHSARVKFTDNQLCTSCHQHPAGKYDSPSHHRHQPGSTGSLCVECHMPETTYMAIDPRRDHSLRVPRPDLSIKYGTPNACTACHIDPTKLPSEERDDLKQYLDWIEASEKGNEVVAKELDAVNQQMAIAFENWYPQAAENTKSNYYQLLAIGKSNSNKAQSILKQLATDRSAPAIFRASAVGQLQENLDKTSIETLLSCMEDSDPKVIASALRASSQFSAMQLESIQHLPLASIANELRPLVEYVTKLLSHDSRLVRIEAAKVLLSVDAELRDRILDSTSRNQLKTAIVEYKESLLVNNDRAASHGVLGNLYEANGEFQKAEDAYRTAISVEPNFSGPRTNLAALIDQKAQRTRYRIENARNPSEAKEFQNQAARLIEKAERLRKEENAVLAKNVQQSEGLPGMHGLYYRFGLSCYITGDTNTAELYFLKAYRQSPTIPVYLLALSTFYRQSGDFENAKKFVSRLLEVSPDNPGYKQLRDEIMAASETKE